MNRKLAALMILAPLATLYALRGSAVLVVVASVGFGLAGLAGLSCWREEPRRWRWTSIAVVAIWLILRSLVFGEPKALFLGEGLLLLLGLEFVRLDDWTHGSPRVAPFGLTSLLCVMQQRVLFAELGLFTFLGILVVLAVAWSSAQQHVVPQTANGRKRVSVAIAILGVAGFASYKVSEVWGEQISVMENRIDMLLSNFAPEREIRPYPRAGNLSTITLEKLSDPEGIAFRVYSNRAPGYVTGRVFDVFNSRAWLLHAPQYRSRRRQSGFRFEKPTRSSGIRVPQGQSIFRIAEERPSDGFETYEITNESGRGNMVFTPRETQYLRGYGRQLNIDDHGVVHAGLDTDSKYYAYVNSNTTAPAPDEDISGILRYVPPQLRDEFSNIANSLGDDSASFEAKVAAVEQFFATDFRYSMTPDPTRRGVELLRHFLQKKEGHCELFATCTALVLRSQGIPARYVTGYICQERDPDDDDYWAALNRDCHAWVEAWNPETERWVLVETTPGMSTAAAAENRASESDAELEDFDEAQGGTTSGSFSGRVWMRAFQWGGLFLTSGMLVWTWIKFRDRSGNSGVANAEILRLDKRLAKLGLARNDGETLHEFADRIEAADVPLNISGAADFYRDYARLLYAGRMEELVVLSIPHGLA